MALSDLIGPYFCSVALVMPKLYLPLDPWNRSDQPDDANHNFGPLLYLPLGPGPLGLVPLGSISYGDTEPSLP